MREKTKQSAVRDLLAGLGIPELTRAVTLKKKIAELEEQLSNVLKMRQIMTKQKKKKKIRQGSAVARGKLAAALKKRETKRRHFKTVQTVPTGGLTAAGRRKLSDALKARWAARRKKTRPKKSGTPTGNPGTFYRE